MGVRRARTLIGVGLLAGAGTLAIAASLIAGTGAADTSAAPASVDAVPSTLAPVTDPGRAPVTVGSIVRPSPRSQTTPPASTTATPGTTEAATLPPSPLAALVGPPEPAGLVPATARPAPVSITIDTIDVSAPIVGVGVQADGQLEIPDETEVGWYRLGSSPGEQGASVLAAHVNWHHVDGPFVRLRELDLGSTVTVTMVDGSTRSYSVVERQQYDKTALPADRIWTRAGPETLVLITCGGSFNPEIRRYRDNIVVFAVPVG